MANFKVAYDITIKNEGLYSVDPDDPGGETFNGISRKNWPSWDGWSVIDSAKVNGRLTITTDFMNKIAPLVFDFYRINFWNEVCGDFIPSQSIANELFDTAVNVSVSQATKFLQAVLNILNDRGNLWYNIKEDGKFGVGTLSSMQTAIKVRGEAMVYKVLNCYQGAFYIKLMENKELNEKYIGWFNRVNTNI